MKNGVTTGKKGKRVIFNFSSVVTCLLVNGPEQFCQHWLTVCGLKLRKTHFCFAFSFQGLQIFIFFTARTPTFRAALKHWGHTITSASLARAQTYHLWQNFKKALSFESYKKRENDKSESTTMSEMNTSASSVKKKWLEWLCFWRKDLYQNAHGARRS